MAPDRNKDIEKDWITQSGLRAIVLICFFGDRAHHRCGYVGVPTGHLLHGVSYLAQIPQITQEIANAATIGKKSPLIAMTASVGSDGEAGETVRRSIDIVIDVHGGVTYSGGGEKYPVEAPLWWFGFDCAHSGDGDIEPLTEFPNHAGEVVRDLDYVTGECESMARQIVDMFGAA